PGTARSCPTGCKKRARCMRKPPVRGKTRWSLALLPRQGTRHFCGKLCVSPFSRKRFSRPTRTSGKGNAIFPFARRRAFPMLFPTGLDVFYLHLPVDFFDYLLSPVLQIPANDSIPFGQGQIPGDHFGLFIQQIPGRSEARRVGEECLLW